MVHGISSSNPHPSAARSIFYYTCMLTTYLHSVNGQTDANNNDSAKPCCRTVSNKIAYECPLEYYDDFTCMTCYWYLPENMFLPGMYRHYLFGPVRKYPCRFLMYKRNGTKVSPPINPLEYDYRNDSSPIYGTLTESGIWFWKSCCEAAKDCCTRMLDQPIRAKPGNTTKYCPKTFDGWQCFEETEAGQIHESYCEDHIHFNSIPQCKRMLTRKCGEDGQWPRYNNTANTEFTEYGPCSVGENLKKRHQVHVAMFIVSICAIAPALVIFFSYKQLRVPRITMHKNLFFSLLLNGIAYIIFKYLVTLDDIERKSSFAGEKQEGSAVSGDVCRFLYALTRYTRATNYMWMFCEGFYLHKLIVAAFSEQKNLLIYYILGWVLPIFPVAVYSVLRVTDPEANVKCWGLHDVLKYEWVVIGPILLSLVVNFLFLFNIIRVLVTKLRAAHTNDPHKQYRKAVRATLVLVPLFGLHFFVTAYFPEKPSCFWMEFYYYVLYVMDGSQGFLVALIFCYFNGEVVTLLRRTFTQYKLQRKLEQNSQHLRDTFRQSMTSSHTPCT